MPQATVSHPTVLVVDDNPFDLRVLQNFLQNQNYYFHSTQSGQEAISLVRALQPDLILLDIQLTDVDGYEICRRIRADEMVQTIPIIFMTALTDVEAKVKGFAAGANDYITKPFQADEVSARIDLHLRIGSLTQDLQQKNQRLQSITHNLLKTSSQLGQYVVTTELPYNELLASIAKAIQAEFGYDDVLLWLTSPQASELTLSAAAAATSPKGQTLPPEASHPVMRVFQQRQFQHIDKNGVDNSATLLPLQVDEDLIGVLEIESHAHPGINEQDVATLQILANQIAVIIRNAQLHELQEERARHLAKVNADRDRFFSIISHDLRGPFQAVVGYAELLMMLLESGNVVEATPLGRKLHKSAKSTYHLLENLLQWSRLQRGRIAYEPEPVLLAELFEETMAVLAGQANNKNIKFDVSIDENLCVKIDHNMIYTVIRNLTSNAIKFTGAGGQVSLTAHPNRDCWVEVSVRDTGIGISQENIEKLFRMDTHLSTPGTADEEGTGLGLILCKEFVENHGGKIWVESELGQGTAVKFTVPLGHDE